MYVHALVMLAAGIGIPLLAALNARLGANIGAPATAAVVLFLVALAAASVVTLVTGAKGVAAVAAQPKHLFLAGVLIAFYVISITYIAPSFGVGNAVFFVLLGQLISAAAIDHFGLFGAQPTPLQPTRGMGIALMAAGVFLTQRA
ncbi:DMT family transporter [Tropicimonas sp. S265A]|uniref:DMT family transporter n=1 Tax=Tropicimonas sp. S265A TaxID=3415134 RepID=UPI003C7B8986